MVIRVVLDTNVILDFLNITRLEHNQAVTLLDVLRRRGVNICAAATSLKDIYYILGRSDGKPIAKKAVESVLATMTILPVDFDCCQCASTSTEPDFEDGIIRAAAEIAQTDYLITRDTSVFIGARVPRLSPTDAIRVINHG